MTSTQIYGAFCPQVYSTYPSRANPLHISDLFNCWMECLLLLPRGIALPHHRVPPCWHYAMSNNVHWCRHFVNNFSWLFECIIFIINCLSDFMSLSEIVWIWNLLLVPSHLWWLKLSTSSWKALLCSYSVKTCLVYYRD